MLTSVEGMWSAQGLSCSTVMLTYIVLQFLLWAVHDGLQHRDGAPTPVQLDGHTKKSVRRRRRGVGTLSD